MMHGLLFQARRKNENAIKMEPGIKVINKLTNMKVYVTKNVNGQWEDEEGNIHQEEYLKFK